MPAPLILLTFWQSTRKKDSWLLACNLRLLMSSTPRDGWAGCHQSMFTAEYFPLCLSGSVHTARTQLKTNRRPSAHHLFPHNGSVFLQFTPLLLYRNSTFSREAWKVWFDQIFAESAPNCSFCPVLIALTCTSAHHHCKNNQSQSETTNEWHYSAYSIYDLKQSRSAPGNRLPLWLLSLWFEIYGPVTLLHG